MRQSARTFRRSCRPVRYMSPASPSAAARKQANRRGTSQHRRRKPPPFLHAHTCTYIHTQRASMRALLTRRSHRTCVASSAATGIALVDTAELVRTNALSQNRFTYVPSQSSSSPLHVSARLHVLCALQRAALTHLRTGLTHSEHS